MDLIANLMQLGLKEYEARIYVALAGLGEANVRKLHEASGVPRPRVYDILAALATRGFIDVRQGSPLTYTAVRPERVISSLKKELDDAAEESRKALAALSVDARTHYSPIWYLQSDRTIQRYLEMLVDGVSEELVILCFNRETLRRFQAPVARIAGSRTVKILFPKGFADDSGPADGIGYYEAGKLRNLFGMNIFEKVFSVPISREGSVFRLECILLADDRESMLIYTLDGNRMAVTITLPFITAVQHQLFRQLIARAREVRPGRRPAAPLRKGKRGPERSRMAVEVG
ncbi:MAG TPA: helix-turn-helix domain-containing protein [Methanomicrobiales archaeon]|nr:helix-turn-helix domain-containing protein [Methanomicrobiales archaeon]